MAAGVVVQGVHLFLPASSSCNGFKSGAPSSSHMQLAAKYVPVAQSPSGCDVGSCAKGFLRKLPRHGLLVSCQSTNGKPDNGTVKGSNGEIPRFQSMEGAGWDPLAQSWDPWKKSYAGKSSSPEWQDSDTSSRDRPAGTSGKEFMEGSKEMIEPIARKKGAVGNEGEEPYRILASGRKAYLDELDILTLLDPPPFIRPMDSRTYNHAAFLWKKIGDIPEERRHHLLDLLQPKHISSMWKMAGLRYDDPKLFVEDAAGLLPNPAIGRPLEPIVWTGQVNGVPWIFGWISRFKKAFFVSNDGILYGRVITGGPLLEGLGRLVAPLYFQVREVHFVPATKEQCDLAFSYEDGHFELRDAVPQGYPQPGRHPWPFGNCFIDYIRPVGPGVVVGQSWYGPKERGPRQYLGEFVLIRNF